MEPVETKHRFRVIDGGLAGLPPAKARAAAQAAAAANDSPSPVLKAELARISDLLVQLKTLRNEIARERDFWRGMEDSVVGLVEPPKPWWQRISG
jgi:predicted secreted protein